MRIAACTVVAVVSLSLDALAQPPAHAHGKANAYAYGHAKRSDFAANDFKIGLPSASDPSPVAAAPGTSRGGGRAETPVVQIELPQPQATPGKKQIPDCIAR